MFDHLVEESVGWAVGHGFIQNFYPGAHQLFLPFTLFPSIYSLKQYILAQKLQKIINKLYGAIVNNPNFLNDIFLHMFDKDPFIIELWKIYEITRNSRTHQLGILRSDYLLHYECNKEHDDDFSTYYFNDEKQHIQNAKLQQVEVNCIAASFGGLSPIISQLHKINLRKIGRDHNSINIPENITSKLIANGLLKAWTVCNKPKAGILFIVEKFSINEYDQRQIEWMINELYTFTKPINIIRRTFAQLRDCLKKTDDDTLIIDELEISIVYYRTGYSPNDYEDDRDWRVRHFIESCPSTIKCPSIAFQLAGIKRVQEMLSYDGILEKYFGDILEPDEIETYRKCIGKFHAVYTFDPNQKPKDLSIINYTIKNYKDMVVKPLREGGGHNLYGEDALAHLLKYKDYLTGTNANINGFLPFVVMEKIHPVSSLNYIVKPIKVGNSAKNTQSRYQYSQTSVVSELGVFGTVLCSPQNEIIYSDYGGLLLRSKPITENETGIMAGFGALDSPFLV